MLTCILEHGVKTSFRHVVVNAIVIMDQKVLLAKRADFLPEGGKWGLPGGFMDRDETLIDAVKREVREETGYDIKNVELFRIVDSPKRPREDRQNVMFIYSADAGEKIGAPDKESSEVRWFRVDKLPDEKEFAYDHFEQIKLFASHNN